MPANQVEIVKSVVEETGWLVFAKEQDDAVAGLLQWHS